MKPPVVDYARANSVAEAVDLLGRYGDESKVLAGGQSLIPMLNMRFAFPTMLIDINHIKETSSVEVHEDVVVIGATVRQSGAQLSREVQSHVPLLAQALPHVGHFVTRNRGTIGGSVVHADARGEVPLVLATLGGQVVVVSASGRRTIEAADLFVTHFTTSIADDELLVETRWPAPGRSWGYAFREFSLRHGDYALGMVACSVHREGGVVQEASVALGAVADRPVVLKEVAASLVGKPLNEPAAVAAGKVVTESVNPSSDLHASDRYRRHLAGLLTKRALLAAWADSGGDLS
ncbi:MAG: xanthine dehydrogenase family protein subunit M [Actinomycetia bacterium]|nr:xanthine dehydrogenase family protein subunit M [Actinomycetes bacterium]